MSSVLSTADSVPTVEMVTTKITELLMETLNVESSELDTSKPFTAYGLDSLDALIVVGDIEDWLGVDLPTTLLWDCANVDEVVAYAKDNYLDLTEKARASS